MSEPAFPNDWRFDRQGDPIQQALGLTKREWFAGQIAAQIHGVLMADTLGFWGMFTSEKRFKARLESIPEIAVYAADKLIEELAKL